MIEALHYEFMRNALIAAVLVGLACGIVGTLVVVKRIVFISGGIAHAAFGGVGLGYLLGVSPVLAAIPFSVVAALGIGTMKRRGSLSEDSAIGIIWSLGMALGILFVGLSRGYAPDLFSYLFGSILTVPFADIVLMLALDAVIIALVLLFYKELLATSFDEEFSEIRGVPTRAIYLILLCLVALSIIVLIRIVGVILVIALLTIPAVIARQFTARMNRMMIAAAAAAVILTIAGLWISYLLNIASGAAIVLVLTAVFFLSAIVKRTRAKRAG